MNQASVFSFRGAISLNSDKPQKCLRQVRDHRGFRNTNRKLTVAEIMAICNRFDAVGARHQPGDSLKWGDSVSGRETWAGIGLDYGISRRHVWAIGTGRVWSNVTGRKVEA